jgi:glycosyltransferase involved in cell wall biosynthesis
LGSPAKNRAGRATVVSLTPVSLSGDSRTLKAAMAYARFGFESVVIEGIASSQPFGSGLPITVHSVASGRRGALRRAGHGMLRVRFQGLVAAGVFAAFLAYYVLIYCVRPLLVMRRGAVYHLHSYEYFPLVWLWCRLFGGCFIYDAHDFYSGIQNDAEMSPARRRWIRPFQLWLERKCVARAAAFLTVNDGTASLMEQQFGRRPLVVRNCHDFRLDRRPPRTVREAAGVTKGDFLVVAPGNWKAGHATAETIEAMALLPSHVHLVFVGGGYEWCRAVAEQHGVTARIHLAGPVAAPEIVPFIAPADAALVCYHRHNANYANALPNGFFQSLAAGLPLVYSNLTGMTQAAPCRGVGMPVDPKSPQAIADALSHLLVDPSERDERRAASRRFSDDVNFEREETILRNIVDGLVAPRASRLGSGNIGEIAE